MENSIYINDFDEIIGKNVSNMPLSEECLKLTNGMSGSKLGGMKIHGVHFSLYYKYDIMAGKVYFPVVISKGGRGTIIDTKEELEEFVSHAEVLWHLDKEIVEKAEILRDKYYYEIRQDEVAHPNRIIFNEAYSLSRDEFIGYYYVEV